VFDWQLTGHESRAALMPVFQQLQQVTAVFVAQRRQAPVIQDEQLGLGQRRHQLRIATVPFGKGEFLEQPGQAEIERGEPLPAGLMPKGTGKPGVDATRCPVGFDGGPAGVRPRIPASFGPVAQTARPALAPMALCADGAVRAAQAPRQRPASGGVWPPGAGAAEPVGGSRKRNTAVVERVHRDLRQRVAAGGRRGHTLGQGEDGVRQPRVVDHASATFCLPHARLHQPLVGPASTNGRGAVQGGRPWTPAMAAGGTAHGWPRQAVLRCRVPPWPQPQRGQDNMLVDEHAGRRLTCAQMPAKRRGRGGKTRCEGG
jgi:hypothetical protein